MIILICFTPSASATTVINNTITSGWTTENISMNGSAWTGQNGGSLRANLKNDTSLNMTGLVLSCNLDEQLGTIVFNVNTESGKINSTNQGTWYGNTILNYSIGVIGNALNFDGIDDYVNVSSNSAISALEGTVSLWVKFDTISKNEVLFISGAETADGINTSNSYRIRLDGATNKIYAGWITSTEPDMSNSDSAVSTGTWYHVVSVWGLTANLVNLYINGKLQESDDLFTNNNKTNWMNEIRMGRSMASATSVNGLDGNLDEVHIYNRVLSASEVAILYNTSLRTNIMPFVMNQTATSDKVINRTGIVYSGQDNINNASIYTRQNGTTTWDLIVSNATSNIWYSITNQFRVMDFAILMQGNGSKTPFFTSLVWDETLPLPTPTPTPTPTSTPTPTPTPTPTKLTEDFDNFTTMQLSILFITLNTFMQPPLLFISYAFIFVGIFILVRNIMRGKR
jgi:hypothetical protein